MSRRTLLIALAVACAALAGGLAVALWPSQHQEAVRRTPDLGAGRSDYRRFCGRCHALAAADAAGFGGKGSAGGGPSLDNLRVSAALSQSAIFGFFAGHEDLPGKMTQAEVEDVSAYIADVTRNHPILARLTDG